jgi:hypothetical protein
MFIDPNNACKTSGLVDTGFCLHQSQCVSLLITALSLLRLFTIKNLHVWLLEFSLVFSTFVLSDDSSIAVFNLEFSSLRSLKETRILVSSAKRMQ